LDFITILLIAIGLSMDATAVAIVKGITVTKERRRSAILLASFFGGFQMIMPLIGWLAGLGLKDTIMEIDHWIAFGLLGLIGIKMIYDSIKGEEEKEEDVTLYTALILAVATSIDALMVGLSFAFLETSIFIPIIIIGSVTFVLSLAGFSFGSKIGTVCGNRIKILGGIILILIGVKILAEHLS